MIAVLPFYRFGALSMIICNLIVIWMYYSISYLHKQPYACMARAALSDAGFGIVLLCWTYSRRDNSTTPGDTPHHTLYPL